MDRLCSVARTLDILGDRWIILILREAFFGVRHFKQYEANLGISTNILSDRLTTLVDNGILQKQKDTADARRIQYSLTPKGLDLYPVTLALMQWGDKYLSDEDGPPLTLFHNSCGKRLEATLCCAHCGEVIDPRDITFDDGRAIAETEATKRPLRSL